LEEVMNTLNSTRFQQQFVVALATVGLTAAITLAAVGPDTMRAQAPSTAVERTSNAREAVPAPVLIDAATPRFQRSNEPAIEADSMNAHGG
jgi:hypothetical protein